MRTNAKGKLLTFDVTGGEAHEVKGYDALMALHDVNPGRIVHAVSCRSKAMAQTANTA